MSNIVGLEGEQIHVCTLCSCQSMGIPSRKVSIFDI